ncbi:MAG: RES family NAD+ phosphorylase [Treponema sp.]|nr:RES family NAD+ phosphorylase [Treponema sp.]
MRFCIECFIDLEIRNIIGQSQNIGDCPICNKKSVSLYDPDKDLSIKEAFDRLFDLYTTESEASDIIPKSAFTTIIEDLIDNWNIFNPNLKVSQIRKILESLCSDINLLTQKVVIAENYNPIYLKENCIVNTGKWLDFSNTIKNINRFHSNALNTIRLKPYLEGLVKLYPKGMRFYRGRIAENEQGFSKYEIGMPPPKVTKSGRANSYGIPRLYLASDEKTVLHEIRSSMYDFVTLGIFELKKDIKVIDLQNIDKLSPFSNYDADIALFAINKQILHDINNEMAKPLRNNANPIEYIPTQYISDYVHSLKEYDGIEYKSTMNPNGYNLAIFDPTLFECINTETIQVNEINYIWQKI